MAGSLNHIVAGDGSFTMDHIDNMSDAQEALAECHQVIAYLDERLAPGELNRILEQLGHPVLHGERQEGIRRPRLRGGEAEAQAKASLAQTTVRPGSIWVHYKGVGLTPPHSGLYEVVAVAEKEAKPGIFEVIYRPWGLPESTRVWSRPVLDWFAQVRQQDGSWVQRFTAVRR